MAYGVRCAPRLGVRLGPGPVPVTGRATSRSTVRSGFYDRAFFADYTPGYLYALWLVGRRRRARCGGVGDLIKLPAILTDVALGFSSTRWPATSASRERRATIAGAVVIVNPITWFDSVVWGQVDSFGTVFLLLSIRELWRGRSERAAILAVVAALVKPQLAILVPIVAVVTIRRALWPDGGCGDEDRRRRRRGFGWERRTSGLDPHPHDRRGRLR